MATSLQRQISEWHDDIKSSGDPRVAHWLLVQSPLPVLVILVTYLFVVFYGPRFMRDRKPYNLKNILYVYNISQVILSAYLFTEVLTVAWTAGYSLKCQTVDYTDNPLAIRMAKICWWYFFCKAVDLLDTVFFILRKKNNQVSVLHVYHHTTMFVMSWMAAKYAPGGQVFITGLLNSFVHTVMYNYYFLSTLGPQMQPYLWWKKYLTQLQLAQFVFIVAHGLIGLYHQCDYPSFLVYFIIIYPLTLIVLFSNFYIQSYVLKRNKQQ